MATDPTAQMNPKQATAYNEALRRIKAYWKSGDTELDLSNIGLTVLPPEIGQLTTLTILFLSRNQLSTLPSEIGQLTALRALDLTHNELRSLPPEICQLTALIGLDLSDNQLGTLPPEIGQLTALKMLLLQNNPLRTLPSEFCHLSQLDDLSLTENVMDSLPKAVRAFVIQTQLVVLDDEAQAGMADKGLKLCWHSTLDTIKQGRVSGLAMVETGLAIGLLVLLSRWFDVATWLAGAVCVAPLMLLRTPHSVRLGVRYWRRISVVGGDLPMWTAFVVYLLAVGIIAKAGWWGVCLLIFPGPLVAAVVTPPLFLVRFAAMLVSFLQHPLHSLAAIPRNWQRVVLATDSMTAPEFLPGLGVREDMRLPAVLFPHKPWGPSNFLRRHGRKGNKVGRWIYWTSFPFLYLFTVAYRWSVKATSVVYLPLIWIVHRGSLRPKDLRQEAEDLLVDPLARIRRWLAVIILVAFACKLGWFVFSEGFTEGWEKTRGLKLLRAFVVPHAIPLWQVASALNAALALGLGYGAWKVAHRYNSGRPPQESTVLWWWRVLRVVSAALALYTISCAFLIALKEGDLWQRISRAVDWQPLP